MYVSPEGYIYTKLNKTVKLNTGSYSDYLESLERGNAIYRLIHASTHFSEKSWNDSYYDENEYYYTTFSFRTASGSTIVCVNDCLYKLLYDNSYEYIGYVEPGYKSFFADTTELNYYDMRVGSEYACRGTLYVDEVYQEYMMIRIYRIADGSIELFVAYFRPTEDGVEEHGGHIFNFMKVIPKTEYFGDWIDPETPPSCQEPSKVNQYVLGSSLSKYKNVKTAGRDVSLGRYFISNPVAIREGNLSETFFISDIDYSGVIADIGGSDVTASTKYLTEQRGIDFAEEKRWITYYSFYLYGKYGRRVDLNVFISNENYDIACSNMEITGRVESLSFSILEYEMGENGRYTISRGYGLDDVPRYRICQKAINPITGEDIVLIYNITDYSDTLTEADIRRFVLKLEK